MYVIRQCTQRQEFHVGARSAKTRQYVSASETPKQRVTRKCQLLLYWRLLLLPMRINFIQVLPLSLKQVTKSDNRTQFLHHKSSPNKIPCSSSTLIKPIAKTHSYASEKFIIYGRCNRFKYNENCVRIIKIDFFFHICGHIAVVAFIAKEAFVNSKPSSMVTQFAQNF